VSVIIGRYGGDLNILGRFSKKTPNTKFHENPSGGNLVVSCGRTVGQTDRHDEDNKSPFAILRHRPKMLQQRATYKLMKREMKTHGRQKEKQRK